MTSRTNSETIKSAFGRLVKSKDAVAFDGLRKLMADAMDWALKEHDEGHRLHIAFGDNYGWCVVHDGKVKAIDVKSPKNKSGEAERELREISSSLGNGWFGVLMAGMGGVTTYYSVRYETGILESTMNFTAENFNTFFHEI